LELPKTLKHVSPGVLTFAGVGCGTKNSIVSAFFKVRSADGRPTRHSEARHVAVAVFPSSLRWKTKPGPLLADRPLTPDCDARKEQSRHP
jgi:hypothetical protein